MIGDFADGDHLDIDGVTKLIAGLEEMIADFVGLLADLDRDRVALTHYAPGSTLGGQRCVQIAAVISKWLLVVNEDGTPKSEGLRKDGLRKDVEDELS